MFYLSLRHAHTDVDKLNMQSEDSIASIQYCLYVIVPWNGAHLILSTSICFYEHYLIYVVANLRRGHYQQHHHRVIATTYERATCSATHTYSQYGKTIIIHSTYIVVHTQNGGTCYILENILLHIMICV